MPSWTLVPCLVALRNEFNELAPGRDKASDGSIGDQAHASSSSDHNPDETGATPYEDSDSVNEVHAIDVDRDLRRAGWSMARAVEIIVTRHRTGRDDRLQNVIYNGVIWSRSWGWTPREYGGSNPHDKHAHFSARYSAAQERDTRPWGLLEAEGDDMPTVDEVVDGILARRDDLADAVVKRLDKDLRRADSGLYTSVPDRAKAGFVAALADGNAAAKGEAPAGDEGRPYRFVRDAFRNMVGGPLDLAAIVAAVGALDQVDEQALAAAIAGPLADQVAVRVLASLAEVGVGDQVSQAEVTEAVQVAFRSAFGQTSQG